MTEDFRKMFKHKKSDTAVVLGSGPSINSLSKKDWEKLRTFDTWAMNNWIYHPFFVPKFYTIEAKHYDFNILKRRLDEKKKEYHNTIFLFRKHSIKMPNGDRPALWKMAKDFPYIYLFKRKPRKGIKRSDDDWNSRYEIDESVLTVSYDISITGLLELLYRMGYMRIILIGVDLYDSRYFWTDGGEKYGEIHHNTNKEHEGKDPNLPHNTIGIQNYIIDYNSYWMCRRKGQVYTATKKTLLYPKLPYLSIQDA